LGTGALVPAPGCVSWGASGDVAPPSNGLPALSPPALSLGGDEVALEPAVLVAPDALQARAGPPCGLDEVPFASGCATIDDDRVHVRAPDRAVLWTIAGGGPALVRSTGAGERFVVRPLPLNKPMLVSALDAWGHRDNASLAIRAAAPRAHVVINEVMANPRGPEPAQEWVELYNDGATSVSLEGYALEDAQGTTTLPAVELAPGAFALVVSRAYTPDAALDAVPALAAALVTVDTLALANDGERLTLRDALGSAVSVFPALKSKNGISIARRRPDADDADLSAFVPSSAAAGSTPGAPN